MLICRNHPNVHENVQRCWSCMAAVCRDCRVTIGDKAYCANCKDRQISEIRSGVASGALEYASILRRFGAIFIDGLILFLPIFLIALFIGFSAASSGAEPDSTFDNQINILNLIMIPIYIIYEALMLARDGQTIGKKALGIRVVTPTGAQISTGQAWGRAALRQVFFSCLAIINYLAAFFTAEKTCIHDMAARTRVVRV